jgi:hypothetical protein
MALHKITDKYSQSGLVQATVSFDSVYMDYVIVLLLTGPALAERIPVAAYRFGTLAEAESVAYNAACDLEIDILIEELAQ